MSFFQYMLSPMFTMTQFYYVRFFALVLYACIIITNALDSYNRYNPYTHYYKNISLYIL